MKTRLASVTVAAAVLAWPLVAGAAIALTDHAKVSVDVRTRLERNGGHDGTNDNDAVDRVTNRVRLGVDLTPIPELRAFVQVQDVRAWGEEMDTLGDFTADGLDLHQAFGDVRLLDGDLWMRIGRQEIKLDEERLIGAVGWTPQARSFDAVRVHYGSGGAGLSGDLFYALLKDDDPLSSTAAAADRQEGHLGGLELNYRFGEQATSTDTVQVLAIVDRDEDADRTRFTVGLRNHGRFGIFKYRIEGYYQGGSEGDKDIQAFLAGVYAGVVLEDLLGLQALLWADYLSGDDDPNDGTIKTFDTLFATNHAFYGWADFFLNVPKHTGGRGLIDLALKLRLKPTRVFKILVDYHHFRAAEDQGGDAQLGNEIDVAASWSPWKPFNLYLGVFVFLPGDGIQFRLDGKDADIGVYAHTRFLF